MVIKKNSYQCTVKIFTGEGGAGVEDGVGGNSERCLKLFGGGGGGVRSLLKLLKRLRAEIVLRGGRS